MFIKWLSCRQKRDDCISTKKNPSSFDLQSPLLQKKSHDIKVCDMKTILQNNSDVIVPMTPHDVIDTLWNTEDPHYTYIMIPFSQREKSLYFPH